ncbi:hypothetical protein [Caldicoprobacter faecalis]|uniref:Uncharacterized protein n=1 Tax=Caldicoprobacter faecalis TaxID=937334 RepID=A0A1I5WTT5_9FIRM|nr:hypothetical protein [Caldicoprobacter faecalis]SFQ23100.1 hypothetical protein SAMN05444406_11929 [Caldicoprobacter faecalis]
MKNLNVDINTVIIPLNIGESVIKEFRIKTVTTEVLKKIAHEKARLIIRDNRDKKHIVYLGYPD